ncbi:peptidase T [Mariniblastus fucicola]|uniref:Peptidase T n=1 Tax=Mariniblastus fucicola TaxID=980251 RepID=A0A5B9P5Z9_9BACT|nr:peptidase T [Mariniblastus fucicola]QEG20350.1 Peptidase T [Mariniblastus fucicola]
MNVNRQRLLDRFLQYVAIDTTANENTDFYPSSPGQLEIGKLLVQQMKEMGIEDAHQNGKGIVMGTVPGNVDAPVVAFNSHVDTSPETSGKNVKAQVIENFDGQDITLPGDSSKVITAAECPELPLCKGKTIITTDGTTLLGGDDKAGVAIIMELANMLIENPDFPHGPVRVLFTCDEEIGRGVDHVSIDKVNATVCYNFDGGGENVVDNETFSADMATVTIRGVNIHPAMAKDRMVNAIRVAARFLEELPAGLSPERTSDREGFLHPYVIKGGVDKVTLNILLRDFDTPRLEQYAELLHQNATAMEAAFPGAKIKLHIRNQYRNLGDGLADEPRAVKFAVEAHEKLGRTCKLDAIRGGTDGSRLTELGLPTPNLSSGQHNLHSPLEWACLDEMMAACEIGAEIVRRWSQEPA